MFSRTCFLNLFYTILRKYKINIRTRSVYKIFSRELFPYVYTSFHCTYVRFVVHVSHLPTSLWSRAKRRRVLKQRMFRNGIPAKIKDNCTIFCVSRVLQCSWKLSFKNFWIMKVFFEIFRWNLNIRNMCIGNWIIL